MKLSHLLRRPENAWKYVYPLTVCTFMAAFNQHADAQSATRSERILITSVQLDTTIDTDKDGLSDGEESFHFGTSILLADSDQDGESDLTEILKGGNPLDLLIPTVNRALHLVAALKVDTTPDFDKDGLSDGVESELTGTHALIPDTDFDGVYDLDEFLGLGNGNPYRFPVRMVTAQRVVQSGGFLLDTTPDTDEDGLSDGYEQNVSMTDFRLKDTDKDNIDDGLEVIMGTNPLDIIIIDPPSSLVFGIQEVSDEAIILFFTGSGNPVIQLYGSKDLKTWDLIDTLIVEGDDSFYSDQIRIPLNSDAEFFRAVIAE